MRVLAIDTALAACSAAVLDTDHGPGRGAGHGAHRGSIVASESLPMTRGHAEALIPLVARVLKSCGLAIGDLNRIVVTTGPGSFTGLRVGIAAARGFALTAKLPAIGVSTLSAYAAPYLGANSRAPVIVAIDARHEHAYLQIFDAGGRTVVAPRLAPLQDAVRAAAEAPACIVGSAARAIADALSSTAPKPLTVDDAAAPDINWVAQIGAIAPETATPPKPQYLRAPDAQPQHAASLPRR
ncbi:MAG: tRNA (adenosine(37)-N6)-threonylcarbamoyltransferase complex dimerization subunit type 1 TsaB [Xanthobacteraceae bacterium]